MNFRVVAQGFGQPSDATRKFLFYYERVQTFNNRSYARPKDNSIKVSNLSLDDSIMEWIIGIGSLILGGGLISQVVMYLLKRHDERQDRFRKVMENILINLSDYGKSLNKALNIWIDNFSNLEKWLDEYISHYTDFNENIDFLQREYKDIIENAEKCVCKFAELCPRRLNSEESPSELIEYCDKTKKVLTNFTEKQNTLKDNILSLINEIDDALANYDDILNHFPDIYTLKKKIRKNIINQFIIIQQANSKINIGITNIKSDPIINLGDKNNLLGNLLLEAIKEVEQTKIAIAQTLK